MYKKLFSLIFVFVPLLVHEPAFFRGGSYPGGCVVLPVDESKSRQLSRRATESKE